MTRDQERFAIKSAVRLMLDRGVGTSFAYGKSHVTTHRQFDGEYKGEVLVKAYQSGTPSFMCVMRPVKGVYYPVTLKRDALELQA
jgi:hypothetical protein